jgi:hypothetical protein
VALRYWQETAIRNALETLLSDGHLLPVQTAQQANGHVLVRIPVPERFESLIAAKSDSMSLAATTLGGDDNRSGAERFRLELGGPDCTADVIELTLAYKKGAMAWQPLDRKIAIPLDRAANTTLITSGFYRPTQYFEGFSLDASNINCVISVERLEVPSPLPSLFTAVLPANWRGVNLAIGFGAL